tara:strand:+ start:907 stop:1842 length:936 start_codon:yes stop_codon:yes gene_type:complete
MPVEFGLSQRDISDKQFLYLLKIGNTSAKMLLLERYRNKPTKRIKLQKFIKQLEESGIKYNKFYEELSTHQVAAILITPKAATKKLPIRSLIHPTHNKSLNDKLSKVWWEEKIYDYERSIRYKSLSIKEDKVDFTTADVKKIRFAIMWLNYFMTQKSKTSIKDSCLSKDAKLIFLEKGFSGLYKIAKSDKRILKKYFLKSDEIINKSFYELASLNLRDVWLSYTYRDKQKIIKSYQNIGLEEHAPNSYKKLPIYYLYNSSFNMDINKLTKLFNIGYQRMESCEILRKDNETLLNEVGIFDILYNQFGRYKN